MTREREPAPPTQLHPGASGTGKVDAQALADAQAHAELALKRLVLDWVRRIAASLGIAGVGATGGYLAAPDRASPREQPASGPTPPDPLDPAQCTPAEREQLLEAERRAARDARTALDACRDAVERLDKEHP